MKKDFYKNNRGNIAIIVAISLTVLIGILALVIDGGYLYASKNKWQNGVEAAALAGAIHLSDDDFETVTRQVALENGLPATEAEGLIILQGFYDVNDDYSNFTIYKDFAVEGTGDYPDDETNNAVMVSLDADVDTFLSGILGRDKVLVSAKAVAYGKRYTFMATGMEGEEYSGIYLDRNWKPGYNIYRDCIIGSNGPVSFRGEEYETFEGTWVEAMGEVTGADGKVDVIELTKPLEAPEIDWDALRVQAEENGEVYTAGVLESWPEEWQSDGYGNQYRRRSYSGYITYWFIPAGRDDNDPGSTDFQGDHEGRTYFFEVPQDPPTGIDGYILKVQNTCCDVCYPRTRTCWNFTLAARCEFSTFPSQSYYCRTTLGNVPELGDEGIVYIYSTGTSTTNRGWYVDYAFTYMTICQPKGVIFHAENDFRMETQSYIMNPLAAPFIFGVMPTGFGLLILCTQEALSFLKARSARSTVIPFASANWNQQEDECPRNK